MRPASTREARFLTGSIMHHVLIMTFTGALGLMSMFLVDLVDLLYLSLLGRTEVAAVIGYAGTIAFHQPVAVHRHRNCGICPRRPQSRRREA
jgi:hypothetical protein